MQYLPFAPKERKLKTFGVLRPPQGTGLGVRPRVRLSVRSPSSERQAEGVGRCQRKGLAPRSGSEPGCGKWMGGERQQGRNGRKSSRGMMTPALEALTGVDYSAGTTALP